MSKTKCDTGYRPDKRSTKKLFGLALSNFENYRKFEYYVSMIRYRGTRKAVDIAIKFTKSKNPCKRALGAEILLNVGKHKEAIDALTPLLHDIDEQVVYSSIFALGWRSTDINDANTASYMVSKTLDQIINYKNHHSARIRIEVACALSFMDTMDLPMEIHTKIFDTILEMINDLDTKVRIEVVDSLAYANHDRFDKIMLTDSLAVYINDESPEVRASALYGLSTLRYPDIVDLLIKELSESDYVYDYLLQAIIEEVPDPILLPVLLELKKKKVDIESSRKLLEKAIKACSKELRPASDSKPIIHIPDDEAWLFQNKEAMSLVRAGLRDAAEGRGIDGGSFMQYLDEEIGNNQDAD